MKTPEEKKKLEETAPKFKDFNKPVLANAKDIIYKAYVRPYLEDSKVLIILANGYYYPTPEVDLYFEATKDGEYKLMQNNSVVTYGLKTYFSAQMTSGEGMVHLGNTVTVEDAHGKHSIEIESLY